MSKVLPEHVKVGTLIWFSSGGRHDNGWDCPAMITDVDSLNGIFYVRSFDDMRFQPNLRFSIVDDGDSMRTDMRLASPVEAVLYLEQRMEFFDRKKKRAQEELNSASQGYDLFKKQRDEIAARQ